MEVHTSAPRVEKNEETETDNICYKDDQPKNTKVHTEYHSITMTTHNNNAEIPVFAENNKKTQDQHISILEHPKATVEASSRLSFKESMKRKSIPGGLTSYSFLLFLIGSQNIISLGSVSMVQLLFWLGITFLQDFMLLHWWISLIVLSTYGILYLTIWKMKQRLRVSAASFFCIIIATVCESLLMVYLALYINPWIVISAMIQITFSMYLTGCLAQCMGDSYTSIFGRIVVVASSLISLIFTFSFLIDAWEVIQMVSDI